MRTNKSVNVCDVWKREKVENSEWRGNKFYLALPRIAMTYFVGQYKYRTFRGQMADFLLVSWELHQGNEAQIAYLTKTRAEARN